MFLHKYRIDLLLKTYADVENIVHRCKEIMDTKGKLDQQSIETISHVLKKQEAEFKNFSHDLRKVEEVIKKFEHFTQDMNQSFMKAKMEIHYADGHSLNEDTEKLKKSFDEVSRTVWWIAGEINHFIGLMHRSDFRDSEPIAFLDRIEHSRKDISEYKQQSEHMAKLLWEKKETLEKDINIMKKEDAFLREMEHAVHSWFINK